MDSYCHIAAFLLHTELPIVTSDKMKLYSMFLNLHSIVQNTSYTSNINGTLYNNYHYGSNKSCNIVNGDLFQCLFIFQPVSNEITVNLHVNNKFESWYISVLHKCHNIVSNPLRLTWTILMFTKESKICENLCFYSVDYKEGCEIAM
jgi:hypothetical protein